MCNGFRPPNSVSTAVVKMWSAELIYFGTHLRHLALLEVGWNQSQIREVPNVVTREQFIR